MINNQNIQRASSLVIMRKLQYNTQKKGRIANTVCKLYFLKLSIIKWVIILYRIYLVSCDVSSRLKKKNMGLRRESKCLH